jgi:hypothetical protein
LELISSRRGEVTRTTAFEQPLATDSFQEVKRPRRTFAYESRNTLIAAPTCRTSPIANC